jgi:glyoxylate reductase
VSAPSDTLPRIGISRHELPGDAAGRLDSIGTVRWWPSSGAPTPSDLAQLLDGCDAALVMSRDRIDTALIDACPDLKWIVTVSAGYENLDLEALRARGVSAANVPGVLAETVADSAWALMLAAARRTVEGDRYIRGGGWDRVDLDVMVGWDVHGANLGIVGFGEVGRAVARRAQGFAMTVRHNSRTPTSHRDSMWTPLEELLSVSDIVVIAVALNESTVGLISPERLQLLKPSAVVVNISRGAVVAQDELARRLRAGSLRAAALDVFQFEPIGAQDALLDVPNLIVTPHIASASVRTRERTVDVAVRNLEAALAGNRMPNELTGGPDS